MKSQSFAVLSSVAVLLSPQAAAAPPPAAVSNNGYDSGTTNSNNNNASQSPSIAKTFLRQRNPNPCSFFIEQPLKPDDADRPDACVLIDIYEDKYCSGKVLRTVSLPTWSVPGSACRHQAGMPDKYSVKDEHCDVEQGIWRTTVFLNSDTCAIDSLWSHLFDPIRLKITTDGCLHGYKLHSCWVGACPVEDHQVETTSLLAF